jgi:hypothetical protein
MRRKPKEARPLDLTGLDINKTHNIVVCIFNISLDGRRYLSTDEGGVNMSRSRAYWVLIPLPQRSDRFYIVLVGDRALSGLRISAQGECFVDSKFADLWERVFIDARGSFVWNLSFNAR